MPDSFSPLWRRALLLMLLGLLLPVQNSLAYARFLAMLTPLKSEPVTAQISVKEMPTAAHHHSSQDVRAVMNDESSTEHHVSNTDNPCHSDAPTTTQNHDCAKCCLMGAAAPPSSAVHAQSQVMALCVFVTSSDSLSGFIPDGLERPPRTQLA
jgi:hypothetical protein